MSQPENTASPYYPWQSKIWQQFCLAKKNNHLPHALLLQGAEDTGKKRFANSIVKSLLCEKNHESSEQGACEACHQCRSCKTYEAKSNPDYFDIDLIEDKQQISIDQIAEQSGFGSAMNLRHHFGQVLGISPSHYRRQFLQV